jgi:hypothetical protein
LVERLVWDQEVARSNRVAPIRCRWTAESIRNRGRIELPVTNFWGLIERGAGKRRSQSGSAGPSSTAMTKSTKPAKAKPPAREKAANVSFVRKLLEDLETVDHAITMARLYAGDKDDFREGIEALVKVVEQQGKVLKDLLLALEDKVR